MSTVYGHVHVAAASKSRIASSCTRPVLCMAASLACGGQVRAGGPAGPPPPAADQASHWEAGASLQGDAPSEALRLSISPYGWLMSQSGDLTVRGITVDADSNFADLLDESDTLFALMGAVDLEYNRFVAQFNAAYSQVEFKESSGVFENGTVSADVKESLAWCELFGGYRLLDESPDQEGAPSRRLTLDGFAGGRVAAIDADTALSASTNVTLPGGEVLNVGATREWGGSRDWFEPFVGARLGLDLTDRWSLSLRGDLGGFGIAGAQFAWSASALTAYRWKVGGSTLAAFVGYRVLEQDYSSGEFGWDVMTHGPLVGAQFSFSF